MAEEPIRKEDIIDIEGAKKAFELLIKLAENLANIYNDKLTPTADVWIKKMQGLNPSLKEHQEIIKEGAEVGERLMAEEKELNKINKETLKIKAQLINSDQAEIRELAKLKLQVRDKNKATQESIKLEGSAANSINAMRAKLKELTAEYNKLSSSARKDAAPAIKKLSDELKKSESAIGNNTRNVGNYTSALQGLPGPLGMAVMGMQRMVVAAKAFIATPIGVIIAAIAAVIGTLTAHFRRAEEGQEKWNKISQTFTVIWGNILDILGKVGKAILNVFGNIKDWLSGDKSLKEAFKDMGAGFKEVGEGIKNVVRETREEIKIARELADLENSNIKRTRQWGIERAKLEARINALREDAEKRDQFNASERIKFINEALALEDKVYIQEKKLAEERLRIQRERNKLSDSNREDLQAEADLEIKLINLESERDKQQRSIEAKKQALLREELKELKAAQMEGPDKIRLKQEEATLNTLRKFTGLTLEEIKRRNDAEEALTLESEAKKQAIIDDSFNQISNSITALSALYEQGKQRELSAAGDNAKRREEIEQKFAKKQQILSIGQAFINGAIAITEIWRKWAAYPVIAGIFTALASAQTLAQVAVIKGQKFAHGGSGVLDGAVHASGGVMIPGVGEAEGGEHFAITSRSMTSKYGSSMLDAVSNSINQGRFFEVWSNANKDMGVHQDIYTKKMYDMMKNTPSTYIDTNGDTVKEYPDGRKFVIKNKFHKN